MAPVAIGQDSLYFGNDGSDEILVANLDGTGGADLYDTTNTGAATLNDPFGVAIDSAAGKIYWASNGGGTDCCISVANLDGSGVAGAT